MKFFLLGSPARLKKDNLSRIPKNLLLGFGRVNFVRSSCRTLLFFLEMSSFIVTDAPVYKASPGGNRRVLLHDAKDIIKIRNAIFKIVFIKFLLLSACQD